MNNTVIINNTNRVFRAMPKLLLSDCLINDHSGIRQQKRTISILAPNDDDPLPIVTFVAC